MSQIAPVIPLDGSFYSSSSEFCTFDQADSMILKSPSNSNQQEKDTTGFINPSSTVDSNYDKNVKTQTNVGLYSNGETSKVKPILVESPTTVNDDFLFEQNNSLLNESTDKVNLSSITFLQSKQRRINHRRNKSEPVIVTNLEKVSLDNSLPHSTGVSVLEASSTSNESTVSSNSSYETKGKPSLKTVGSAASIKQTTINNSFSLQDKPSTSATKKKKPWYNPFQSTYRERNVEFRKIFKDLSIDERLIVDYSCAWQKEILIQGRMYISQYNLYFYANFLRWETSLCLRFKDITSITREKTAKVIPNAIEIRANKNEKYFFASFATRDKSYSIIHKIWTMALTDQPISSQQIWTMIHDSYGQDLDMTTDEEDPFHKLSNNSTPDKTSPKQEIKNRMSLKSELLIENGEHLKLSEKEEIDDQSSVSSSRCERQTDDDIDENNGIIPIGEEASTNTLIRQTNINRVEQENPSVSMENQCEVNYLTKCPCPTHLATELINRTYSLPVERLFSYIFEDKEFLAAYHSSRRIKEFHDEKWKSNDETKKRERTCTYKVGVSAVFGATTICSYEKQIIECELKNSHYIIDTEVRNEGIKYADAFYVASRYCLVQVGPNKSHLTVTSEVRYVKSLMMIIKSFIEKNAMAALQDSYTDLNNRLDLSTNTVKRIEQEVSIRQRSANSNSTNEKEKVQTKKKHSRKQQTIDFDSSVNNESPKKHRKHSTNDDHVPHNPNQNFRSSSSDWSINHILIPFCIITMLILLSVNIFLFIKLNEIDHMTVRLLQNSPPWFNKYSYPKEESHWLVLLQRQEEYYQTKLNGLRSILMSTHDALKNVTDTLSEISKLTTSEVNSNAPIPQVPSS